MEGTPTGTATDATGHYLLRNLRAGTYNVVVEAIGYKTATKKVTIIKGAMVELNFAIESMPLTLDQVVITSSRSERLKQEAPSLVSVIGAETFSRVASNSLSGG